MDISDAILVNDAQKVVFTSKYPGTNNKGDIQPFSAMITLTRDKRSN